MTTWEQASAKIGNVSAKARSIAREIFDAAQKAGHDVWFIWGDGPDPDHVYNREGRPVLDFMVKTKAAGDWVRDYTWNHRARLGLKHVIWWQHVTSTVNQPGVVRKMTDRGTPTANHMDHNHSEWFAGNYIPPKEDAEMNASEYKVLSNTHDRVWELYNKTIPRMETTITQLQETLATVVAKLETIGSGGVDLTEIENAAFRGAQRAEQE